jgi:hypothetical protein
MLTLHTVCTPKVYQRSGGTGPQTHVEAPLASQSPSLLQYYCCNALQAKSNCQTSHRKEGGAQLSLQILKYLLNSAD